MIPSTVHDVDESVGEAKRQLVELKALLVGVDEAAAAWRVSPKKWSMTGHAAHLAIINEAYLRAIEKAVQGARQRGGLEGNGPYRHPRVTTWFARSMEPPPKRRIKTFRSMVPDPGTTAGQAQDDFTAVQEKMIDLLEAARGLDLGRVRFGSPFFALLRFSLGTGFETLLAHNRRHIWLVREVMETEGFPGELSDADGSA